MKQGCRYFLGALAVAALSLPAYAAPGCDPSARLAPQSFPSPAIIPSSNNLLLPAGKSIPAEGQPLTLRGRLLDRECKPIPDAIVELWQVDPFGRINIANREERVTPRPVFAGAGRTYTDHEGYFVFFTAFPAPQQTASPTINLRIKPKRMAEYQSVFFFEGDERSGRDPAFRKLAPALQRDLSIAVAPAEDGGLYGEFTVVLPGQAPYRTY